MGVGSLAGVRRYYGESWLQGLLAGWRTSIYLLATLPIHNHVEIPFYRGEKAQRLSNGCVILGSARAMNSKFSAAVLVINGHVYTNLWLRSNCASNIGLLTTTWCLDKIRPMPISFDTLGIAMADNEYLAQDTFVQNAWRSCAIFFFFPSVMIIIH